MSADKILPFIATPRFAIGESTGLPITFTPEEWAERRARAALRIAVDEWRIDQQRQRLAARVPPANDNADPRWRGNLPVLHKIARQDPAGAYAVAAWGRASSAARDASDDQFDLYQDGSPVEMDSDRRHSMSPTVEAMLADVIRVRVVTEKRKDKGKDAGPGRGRTIEFRHAGAHDAQHVGGRLVRLGNMTFNYHRDAKRPAAGGLMTLYLDGERKERVPRYEASKQRGKEDVGRGLKQGVNRPICLPQEPEVPHVSTETAQIIEMILAGFHLAEIGVALGFSEQYADRGVKPRIAAAISEAKAKFPVPTQTVANDNKEPKARAA